MSAIVPQVGDIQAHAGADGPRQGLKWNIPELATLMETAKSSPNLFSICKSGEFSLKSTKDGCEESRDCHLVLFVYGLATTTPYVHLKLEERGGACSFDANENLKELVAGAYFQGQNPQPILGANGPFGRFWEGNKVLEMYRSGCCVPKFIVCFHSFRLSKPQPNFSFSLDTNLIFSTQKYSDFCILVGGKEFPVHKGVLAAHSEVLDTMFQAGMSEEATDRLEILDFPPESVECFLKCLYGCAQTAEVQQHAIDLFRLADKYAVLPLKRELERLLCEELDVAGVCERLILADLHHAEDLKKTCAKFIVDHKLEVVGSKPWKKLWAKYPALVIVALGSDGWAPRRKRKM